VARVEGSALVAHALQREGIEVLFGLAGPPDIRYDKILEAFGGHTAHVVHPEDIRPALTRAYQATTRGHVVCVNVIADPQESMATRSQRAGALVGYSWE
jgi:thiamine pyrophosphate-dependent acetolactate synthase large subunit-like protein